MNDGPYYGKYRGVVLSPLDTGMKGRITVTVTVGGTPMQVVAEACTPYPGFYAIPPAQSGVWIEFEEGNLDKPIWTGCWWREGEIASLLKPDIPPSTAQTVVFTALPVGGLATQATARLKMDSTTGDITLESLVPPPPLGASVKLSATGIKVTYGLNVIDISAKGIDLNNQALTILPGP